MELGRYQMSKEQLENYIETHLDRLQRILYVYAKLNPGVGYI